ncbi:MAG: iron ABC transporter substrate-binding protein [Candidatus Nanopelagicales bacterium]|nr:iron ABC transporter substrate-binding protein [Candidatus Nanopelagicales bacterium]
MTRRAALAAAALLAASAALTACSSGDSGASDEPADGLVVYSGRSEELVGTLFAQFTAETGIPVEARYGDTAELAAQMIEEGDATPAQVFFAQDAGALGAVSGEGLLAQLPTDALNQVPANYRSADGTWVGVSGRARVIAYDGEQLTPEQVPTSIFDLTDPKWKSQVAIAPTNASFQSFVTALRVTDGDDVAREWLAGLVANDVQKFEKNGLILDAVDAGQVQLGLINHYYWYEKAAEVGADSMRAQISFTAPADPGSLVNVAGVGITTPAAESNNARTFVEWMLSPTAQQYFVDVTYEYPVIETIAAADGLPPLATLRGPDIELAELADLPGTLAMLEDVGLL